MADLEDVTLDGRPLHSLRVADLKTALEERGLPKSGPKNALIKRLKGALMLENLQRTSTPHIGLQPNSQIGEEMSQNSFIKQYLAKQQELLRQRLEREAREVVDSDDQEDHAEVNNSTSCPAPAQDVAPVLGDQNKLLGPSDGEGLAGPANEGESYRAQEANMSSPPASALPTSAPGSMAMRVAGGEHRPERVPTSSQVPADSDDEDSEGGEEDGEDDDWDSDRRRRNLGEPARGPVARERSGASHQPPQHIPPLLSPQLRQPTPPPSPPPELSFPLPDTPKQSPPSPDVPAARQRTSSTSSSGSSSSGSRSSSPEPQRSGHTERKPGPLTLLARKMASEGAFSGAEWHSGTTVEENSSAPATMFPGRGAPEGMVSALAHTANVPLPMIPGTNQSIIGAHLPHSQGPVSVLRATASEERDREREQQLEREEALEQERLRALELERQERQRILEQERAMELERERALAQEQEKALERERIEREKALQREEREKALQREREVALQLEREERERALAREKERSLAKEKEERERALAKEKEERERALAKEERERALAKERAEREQALARERAFEQEKELERQRAIEQEQALQREREERERALQWEREEKERAKALEQERKEMERALELERLERVQALEREREERIEREKVLEQERLEKEKALERERVEKERMEREALEQERIEKEKALERERIEKEKALERERVERERLEREKALERERIEKENALEQERIEKEKALEQERIEKEKALERDRIEKEKALERERVERERLERENALEQERIEKEKALERDRIEKEKALERERVERERLEREKALERERIEKEKALERERIEKGKALEQERIEKEKALERETRERLERERALEQERIEKEKAVERERIEKEKALDQERIEKEKALERERMDREKALERERAEKEMKEKALEQERVEREQAKEKEREKALERERLEKEKALEQARAMEKEREERDRALEQEKERAKAAEKESHLPPWKRGREIGLIALPTPPPLSTGAGRMAATEAGQQEGREAHVQTARRENQPAESGTPISLIQATPLPPQPSFKKFRFLRDPLVQSPSSPMVIKRPRTFSDSPQPQALPLSCPTKAAVQEKDGAQLSTQQEAPQVRSRQGVLVSGPHGSEATAAEREAPVITAMVQSPHDEKARSLASEKTPTDLKRAEQQATEETTKKAKDVDEGKDPSSPQRGRGEKKEKRERRKSSSSESSSSGSDSGSSSSRSSSSSSSSPDKTRPTSGGRRAEELKRDHSPQDRLTEAQAEDSTEPPRAALRKRGASAEAPTVDGASHNKKPFLGEPAGEEKKLKRKDGDEEEEKKDKPREVKEVTMAEPEKVPEISEETPKAFAARRISLSSSKASPGTGNAEAEQESGAAAGRKRRWGSSTAVTAKKPSISITTDSLKSLIPDIRPSPGQEAVVDLHPEEAVLSGAEDEEKERPDQDLQIRRTVTQVVPSESQENGQKETKRSRREELEEEEDLRGDRERRKGHEDKVDTSFPGAMETQSPSHTGNQVEMNTVTPSDTLIRRSISQQKSGVSITIDDPVRTARQASPPRSKVSNIVHVSNLVRPFTLGQLKELLGRTGSLLEEGFWIDKIKSHCYVTYSSSEEAVATRAALHGVKWPQSNPKVLNVDFCQQDELDFHRGLGKGDRPGAEDHGAVPGRGRASGLPSLLPERDQWAEREREMERREKARTEREWDRDKVREFGKPGEEREGGPRRSRSRERRRKERGKSKEKKADKKEKAAEEPPAKLLDDLFRKTKAAPCIYWLPLTEEQFVQRTAARAEQLKEREKLRKERQEEDKKREEERKERMKTRGAGGGDRVDGEKDKDRDRERDRERGRDRDRENDKRRDSFRKPGGSGGAGGGRRSRSRSDPRDRRR